MATNRCPNPKCEFFNKTLPNNAKSCPWCGTALGNVITPKPVGGSSNQQSHQSPQPPQPPQTPDNYQEAPSVANQQNYYQPQNYQQPTNDYQTPVGASTQYQARPSVAPPNSYSPPTQKIPTIKLIHTSGREFYFCGEEGFIGRRSANEPNFTPDVDLSVIPHQNVISRRHARIYWDWSQNTYMIVDMSTNGIYLSNNLLNSGIPYRLINGVPMQLGQDALVNFTVMYV